MTYSQEDLLTDLLNHPDQRVDDLEAIRRYAIATARDAAAAAILRASHAYAHGRSPQPLPRHTAREIAAVATDRADDLQALIHDGLAYITTMGPDPRQATLNATPAGRDAICGVSTQTPPHSPPNAGTPPPDTARVL